MPLMIPDDIEEFTTPGEEVFYRFLLGVAKPDERFIVWYAPDVADSEPDFLLFCPEVGLVVFEVKDWVIDQICEVSPKTFKIRSGAKEEGRTNPYEQARGYVFNILETLRSDGRLVNRDGFAQGKPKIPISHGVVFPNINAFEYKERFSHEGIIPTSKIFFWDDLHPHSPLSDPTGKAFHEAICQRFEPKFPFRITPIELNHLRQLLYPTIRVNTPKRGAEKELENFEFNVKLLDHHQEAIARRFNGGHRIITGPSGCGKTLVLVHQAVLLSKYNPNVKRILFLCYNVTLVNYLKRLIALQGVPLGPAGVEVLAFYDLCEKFTREKVHHEKEDQDYYSLVVEDALSKSGSDIPHFDAILVDEGQDFSDSMLKVVLKCLNRRTDFLTIALDEGQDLYGKKRSWKEIGINAKGRTRNLSIIYRNTKQIAGFAHCFRYGEDVNAVKAEVGQGALFPDPRIATGPCSTLKKFESLQKIIDHVAIEIRQAVDTETFPLSEIAILYTSKTSDLPGGATVPQALASALESHGILSKWLSEDYRAKRSNDLTSDSVTISTIHSAKGLDFACVFLIGLDALEAGKRWSEEQIYSLTYVGMTRARYRLEIPYTKVTPLIERLVAAVKKS